MSKPILLAAAALTAVAVVSSDSSSAPSTKAYAASSTSLADMDASFRTSGAFASVKHCDAANAGAGGGGGGEALGGGGGGAGGGGAGGGGAGGGFAMSPPPPTVSEEVQADADAIEAQHGIQITGEWTPEGIAKLSRGLDFLRDGALSGLNNLYLIEYGDIGGSGGVGGVYNSGQEHLQINGFQTPSGGEAPRDGSGFYMDVLTHEYGHALTLGRSQPGTWKNQFQQQCLAGPDVGQRYEVAGRPAEKMAGCVSKLVNTEGDGYFVSPAWTRDRAANAGTVDLVLQVAKNVNPTYSGGAAGQ